MKGLVVRDSLAVFLKDLENYPVLSREEEYRLAVKYREEGDLEAARRLVLSNLRFVIKIASEYTSYGFSLLDLVQEGAVGLMRAVKKFNPHRGYRLISYAVWWIRAQIKSFIMRSWSVVKIGTTQAERKLFKKLGRARKKLGIASDDYLSEEDVNRLAEEFNVKEKDVLSMHMRMAARDFSLDAAIDEDESLTYLDTLPQEGGNQEDIIEALEMERLTGEGLKQGLQMLSPKERHVIESRYLTQKPLTLSQIGENFGVSKERMRQIESAALEKLRSAIESRF